MRADRLLVKPKAGVTRARLEDLHAGLGVRLHRHFAEIDGWQVLGLPPGLSVAEALAGYRNSGLIELAEPDYLVRVFATPDDPRFSDGTLWGLKNHGQNGGLAGADINAPAGWDALAEAGNVVVAVVDSGVRYTHEDLAANLWRNPGEIPGNGRDDDGNGILDDVHGLNAITNTGDPLDDHGHGTHVAGIIGAVGNNGLGVVGVAWRVQIMACKFMDATGNGSVSDAVQCIDYARQKGAKVINASWGGPNSSSFLKTAIDKARQAGILFVAAAGNDAADNDTTPTYPANYQLDNILVVAATTRTDALADYSNYGATTVDLAAPGSVIYSTWHTGDDAYLYLSGTSMATPYVAGAGALLRARFAGDTHQQLIDRLLAATDPVPALSGKCVTGGRLNLAKALGPSIVAAFSASPASGSPPLTVSFTDQSRGSVTSWLWDFGDGTPASTQQHPTHVFDREGNFTVTLTVSDAKGVASTARQIIAVIPNYEIKSAPFDWIDPGSMAALSLTDNGVSAAQSLPFTFHFYGQNYGQFFVGANGLLGFLSSGLSTAANTDLPNAAAPNAALFPYWDDLDPSSGGSVRVGVIGAAPNRRAVVAWVNVPRRAKPPTVLSFQAVLQEGANDILFQYLDVDPSRSQGAGRSATIGVENETGAVAAKYSVNGSAPLANQQAIRFVPSSSGGMTVTPTEGLRASGPVGGPFAPQTQTYTIENTGAASLDWTASKSAAWISLSAAGGTLAPGQRAEVTVAIHANANTLPAGSYLDTLSFVNQRNGLGNTTRSVSLTVNGSTGVLAVTPEWGFTATGPPGGPFGPLNQIYTLINVGDATLDWTATESAAWLSLSAGSGSLPPGASTTVTVSLTAAANQLAPGTYSDVIQFTNLANGQGDTRCPATLIVTAPSAALAVAPMTDLNASGMAGGPFTPEAQIYSLGNTGGTSLNWEAVVDQPWVSISSAAGTLAPGESVDVTVSLNGQAGALPAGSHTATVSFADTSAGLLAARTAVHLTVHPLPGQLAVTPAAGFESSGVAGGPFSPGEQTYTLSNVGGTAFDWTASQGADWLDLSASSGRLAPGETTTVRVSLNASADLLVAGGYTDTVRFANISNGNGDTNRPIKLVVQAPPGVLAVTPESDFSASGLAGGPFAPAQASYLLSNSGGSALEWTATAGASWLSVSAGAGGLAPGEFTVIEVSVNDQAAALALGTYSAVVEFKVQPANTAAARRAVTLSVHPAPGRLVVTPETIWSAAGFVGGPFSPEVWICTVSNLGGTSVEWTATASEPWLTLSSLAGTLGPGESASQTVALSAEAAKLRAGSHTGRITFTPSEAGATPIVREVVLDLQTRPLILSLILGRVAYPVTLGLAGDPDTDYVIETSSDLAQWSLVATVRTAADGSVTFLEPGTAAWGCRFFRASRAP